MSMNTPIGNITQTTPIKDFKELGEMQNEQYLLGIDNNAVGNGSKISLENLINSSISTDSDNLITKGTDDRLLVNTPVEIGDLSDLTTTDKTTLVAAINEVNSDITTEVTNRVNAVSGEATIRANADNNLQSQIDAITTASDVTDIVGTYAELQAYDTTGLADNSVIKVLQDESRQNETTYYRWVITGGVGAWVLVGEEGPYYTISQADSKFVTQATVGNLSNLATSDKSSVVNAMNELASVLDPTQTADYIKNSKAIYSGEVSENALILPQIKEMAHSTFDRSKFTVVGSPNITDDGIASGFANYPRIAYGTYDLTKKFKVRGRVIMNGTPTGNSQFLALKTTSATADPARGCGLYFSDNALTFTASKEGQTAKFLNIGSKTWQAGDVIDYVVENNLTNITATIYVNGELFGTPRSVNAIDYALGSTTYASTNYFYGQSAIFTDKLDLKYCKVEIDGVEVFSGNKTGIDTIKPDNYTIVGTPTISVDGVLSNVSLSNYLSKTLNLTYTNTCEVIYSVNTKSVSGLQRIYGGDIGNVGIGIVGTNMLTVVSVYSDNSTAISRSFEAKANTNYLLKVKDDGTNLTVWYKESGGDWIQVGIGIAKTGNIKLSGNLYIGRQNVDNPFLGTIDLNKVKTITDGNLVYQPCLKIPYTEAGNGKGYNAETGSKIVQSTYRDRVVDMYEQFGYAPYYTLSDTDFTLPQGEIYGYLEKRARDIAHPVAQPFYRFSDEINEDEVRLEGAEVDKGLYLAIEQDPYLSALCTAGSTTDKICLPDFRNRVIYGDVVSGYIEPELPNITGNIHYHCYNESANTNGAFWLDGGKSKAGPNDGGTPTLVHFDASRSSSIYKNGGTVKTAGVKARWLCRWK